jgi:hypothetical protein
MGFAGNYSFENIAVAIMEQHRQFRENDRSIISNPAYCEFL